MKSIIVMALLSMVGYSGDSNTIFGNLNTIQGNINKLVAFNSLISGSDNWIVGNRAVAIGNGIKMFGTQADPKYYHFGFQGHGNQNQDEFSNYRTSYYHSQYPQLNSYNNLRRSGHRS